MKEFLVPTTIETDRLLLRQFKDEDWADLHLYYSDADAVKFTMGEALTEGKTWRAMASMIGHWQLRGYGPYALEEKASGKVLGTVGLWYPNDWPEPEIKWGLAPPYWGKGFASEAARAVQTMAKTHLPDINLISFINAKNQASINLALAIKAVLEKEVEFRGSLWHIYRHP